MKRAVLLALLLGGCASEPMTDEQRQLALQYLMNRPQPQPYVLPMPPPVQPVQPVQQPRICQSQVNGQTINTTCY